MLFYVSATRHPDRNRIIVLLSVKADLRAGEIANLTWDMITDGVGNISATIELRDNAAKMGSGRHIPMNAVLRESLLRWRTSNPGDGPVIVSERGGKMRPLTIVIWFARAYETVELVGCSSHSGRRTFITRAARMVPKVGGSLRDVQLLAGHRSIQTTQGYIEGDSDAQRRLVSLI